MLPFQPAPACCRSQVNFCLPMGVSIATCHLPATLMRISEEVTADCDRSGLPTATEDSLPQHQPKLGQSSPQPRTQQGRSGIHRRSFDMNHSGASLSDFFQHYASRGEPLVLATVTQTLGSTYRKAGAQMLISG